MKKKRNHMHGIILIIAAALIVQIILPIQTFAQADAGNGDYVSVNGLNYYYEIHCAGNAKLIIKTFRF